MKEKALTCDIVISGAGPAGSTLAALLGKAGFDVVLIDAETPAPKDAEDKPSGRTAALFSSSINVLKASGAWEKLQEHGTPMKMMRIVDDNQSVIRVEFRASDIGFECFGYNIPNNLLKKALQRNLEKIKSVRHLAPCRLSGYEIDGQRVVAATEDGQAINAALIVGTDGRGSVVRSVSHIDAKKRDYGQIAMTFLIGHTKPHNFTSTEHHRPGGPFTLVPMPGNQSSVVWVEKADDAKRFLAMKKQDFEQAVQDRTKGLLGTITLKSNPESWPLMLLDTHSLVGERSALAAEAAHVLSPIGAQGLNLSLRDVATLAETLTDAARLGEDIGSPLVLSRYEQRRRIDIKSHVVGIDGLNRAVANDTSFVMDLRRLGLKGLEKIPALKNLAMYQGLVPSMDEGRLLAGKPL